MEPVFQEMLKGSPTLGVVVVIVWIFVNFLGKEGDKNRALFQSINEQNLSARKDTERALNENAASTRENTSALHASAHETTAALRAVETAVLKFSNHK